MVDSALNRSRFVVAVLTGTAPLPGQILTKLCGMASVVVSLSSLRLLGHHKALWLLFGLGGAQLTVLGKIPKMKNPDQAKLKATSSPVMMLKSVLSSGFVKTCYANFMDKHSGPTAVLGGPLIDCPLVDMSGKQMMISELIKIGKPFILGFGSCT